MRRRVPRFVWALGSAGGSRQAACGPELRVLRRQDVEGDGRVSLAEWMVFELDLVDRMAATGQVR